MRGVKPTPITDRIRASVTVTDDGCWEWQKFLNSNGYGVMYIGSRTDGTRRLRLAHRVSYEVFCGTFTDDLTLDHLCRNKRCVNPAHLEPVTRGENIRRGDGPSARNNRKTHCMNGHEFTPENTYENLGKRYCRQCGRAYRRQRRAALIEQRRSPTA